MTLVMVFYHLFGSLQMIVFCTVRFRQERTTQCCNKAPPPPPPPVNIITMGKTVGHVLQCEEVCTHVHLLEAETHHK